MTNITSGDTEFTREVVAQNSVPLLTALVQQSNMAEVKEQLCWCLGNIAGDSPGFRDLVLSPQLGFFDCLLGILRDTRHLPLQRIATWTLSNLCRGKHPAPDWSVVAQALPVFAQLLHTPDEEVLSDACWGLSYLSDGSNEHIEDVCRADIVPRLIQLLLHSAICVRSPGTPFIGCCVHQLQH